MYITSKLKLRLDLMGKRKCTRSHAVLPSRVVNAKIKRCHTQDFAGNVSFLVVSFTSNVLFLFVLNLHLNYFYENVMMFKIRLASLMTFSLLWMFSIYHALIIDSKLLELHGDNCYYLMGLSKNEFS